ncbi:GtrA-like family protein [Sphingomonas sp. EC-HK361]|uniref:GtrA family protein n=1 Tax=Sphingomonas sp. EC-HK361 TaxID=2038397 RepID=UPI0012595776|nr:GtrA family protein [Sphingomonas sp. EC-HK361]VVS98536.1 GtrA-like family protein [Sphingomonas sp. EC-HK361]
MRGRLDDWRASGMLGQLIRFGIAGGLSTVIYAAVYLPLTTFVFDRRHAVYAVPFAFAVAVTAGFFLHSRWSFKDHGSRDRGGWQQAQFVAVQASGMALNALVTWIGTAQFGLPAWAPLLPAVLLATIFTFILNRWLVFA